jgi:hypothetical protein
MTKEPQIKKFRDAARKLETSEDEAAFDQALKRVAKSPLPKEKQPKPKKPAQ